VKGRKGEQFWNDEVDLSELFSSAPPLLCSLAFKSEDELDVAKGEFRERNGKKSMVALVLGLMIGRGAFQTWEPDRENWWAVWKRLCRHE
jgi:hypothetical protein